MNSRKQKGVGKRSREVKTDRKEKDQQDESFINLQTINTEHEKMDGVTINFLDKEIDFLQGENDQQQADFFTHVPTMNIFDEVIGFTHIEIDEKQENSHTGFISILDEKTGLLRKEKNQQYEDKNASVIENFDGITSFLQLKEKSKKTKIRHYMVLKRHVRKREDR